VADAYVLARMSQREGHDGPDEPPSTGAASGDDSAVAAGGAAVTASGSTECPECGKELDPDLDFCPWCTTRLDVGTSGRQS
jgi:hypothetical protein